MPCTHNENNWLRSQSVQGQSGLPDRLLIRSFVRLNQPGDWQQGWIYSSPLEPGPGLFIEALTLTWSRYLLKSTLASGIVRLCGHMTSMTQNRALSLVHPSVDTSTNHNIGSKSRVEGGHHYLDFRLTLDLVRQNIFGKWRMLSS